MASSPGKMVVTAKNGNDIQAATLSRRALNEITQITQEIRVTLKRVTELDSAPLAVCDADAVDAIKDLFYVMSNEDPLNAMPARKLLCEQRVAVSCLLPLLSAVNADTSVGENSKRWSVVQYHTFRALSQMCAPIPKENEFLRAGCSLDILLLDMRVALVRSSGALEAIVALLQYYVERRAEKQARFAPAEECRVEDARIENILVFFRNILAPPRSQPQHLRTVRERDRPIHLALIAVLQEADLYATLAILFSSREEARGQMTRLVFTVAEIYRHSYRYSSPKEIAAYAAKLKMETHTKLDAKPSVEFLTGVKDTEKETEQKCSVFDFLNNDSPPKSSENAAPKNVPKRNTALEKRNRRGAALREAMQRDRTLLGGTRAINSSVRWTNRHSGGFTTVARSSSGDNARARAEAAASSGTQNGKAVNPFAKCVVAARTAVQQSNDIGPAAALRRSAQLNSDLLCATTAVQCHRVNLQGAAGVGAPEIRAEQVSAGLRAVAALTTELIEVSFSIYARELRQRIDDRSACANVGLNEELAPARRAHLALVAVVVGFQRERCMSESAAKSRIRMASGDMQAYVALDACDVGDKWVSVEAGIELASFRLAFDMLRSSSDNSRDDAEDAMLATGALRQMMLLVQSMVLRPERIEDLEREWHKLPAGERPRRPRLTGREMALNTLEELFEREDYLNAPCSLARDYDPKVHTFAHLANVVEVAHAFTVTLLDEKELGVIKVVKKKCKRNKKKIEVKEKGGELKNKSDESIVNGNADGGTKNSNESNDASGDVQKGNTTNKPETPADVNPTTIIPVIDTEASDKVVSEPTVGEDNSFTKPLAAHPATDEPNSSESKQPDTSDNNVSAEEANSEAKAAEAKTSAYVPEEGSTPEADVTEKTDREEPGSENEVECKVESIGVIRRFAHRRALQVLSLPIRAIFCSATSLTGALYALPDGSRGITSCELASKSVAVLTSIWGTSGRRDKGALHGQYFTFPLLQLLSLAMNAKTQANAAEDSIIGRLASLGVQVTRSLHSWVLVNPGLALDVFLGLDKGACLQYAHAATMRQDMEANNQFIVADGNIKEDRNVASDAEDALDEIERRTEQVEVRSTLSDEERAPRGKGRGSGLRGREAREKARRAREARRRRAAANAAEDDDVDDIDALNIGERSDDEKVEEKARAAMSDATLENSATPRARRRKKRKARLVVDAVDHDENDPPSSSESDISDVRTAVKRKIKKRKSNPAATGENKKRGKKKAVVYNRNIVDGETQPAVDPMSDDDLDDDELEKFNKFLEQDPDSPVVKLLVARSQDAVP